MGRTAPLLPLDRASTPGKTPGATSLLPGLSSSYRSGLALAGDNELATDDQAPPCSPSTCITESELG